MQIDLDEMIRMQQYPTGTVAIGNLMRELFAERLAAQARAIEEAQADSLDSLLLDENSKIEVSLITRPWRAPASLRRCRARRPGSCPPR